MELRPDDEQDDGGDAGEGGQQELGVAGVAEDHTQSAGIGEIPDRLSGGPVEREDEDQIGFIDQNTRAIFGRSYAAEPDVLIEQLRQDEAIAEADTLLLTVPNQLGVAYNAHVIEAILTHIAPALGWR